MLSKATALRARVEFLLCRLRQLDKHGQATAQQLVQLLNKQNQLLLERQSLSEEVDRLRAQVGWEDTPAQVPGSPVLNGKAHRDLCGPG